MHLLISGISTGLMNGVIPNPTPVAPPGSGPVLVVLNWVSYGCLVIALLGFLISAGSLALAHHNGRASESFKGLAYAIGASILVGAAGGIMQIFQA
jgi:hypothetical protein